MTGSLRAALMTPRADVAARIMAGLRNFAKALLITLIAFAVLAIPDVKKTPGVPTLVFMLAVMSCAWAGGFRLGGLSAGLFVLATAPKDQSFWWRPQPLIVLSALAGALAFDLIQSLQAARRKAIAYARLAAIVQSSDDAVISKDLTGIVTSWNAAAERLFGYSAAEMIGHPVYRLLSPDRKPDEPKILERLHRGERVEHFESARVAKDGRTIDISLTISPIRDAAGKVIGTSKIVRDITGRKRAEESLRASERRVVEVSRRLILAEEAERRHLARELHDETGQGLMALKLNIQSAMRNPAAPTTARRLEESLEIVDRTIAQVRCLSAELRPSLLDDFGLVAALQAYCDASAERTGIAVEFVADPAIGRCVEEVETAGYRIVQEAMNNITKHAGAGEVRVRLDQVGDDLTLEIADDGIGFDIAEARTRAAVGASVGVLGMQERAELVGGVLTIESGGGRGTTIRASLPFRPLVRGEGPPARLA